MPIRQGMILSALLLSAALAPADVRPQNEMEAGRQAFEAYDYTKAAQLLQQAAARSPQNGDIHLLLAKTYFEAQQYDAAIASAEKAIALNPEKSAYHEWLGKSFGEKASHAAMFSALSLAKKTRREFEKAVELDNRNFGAYQALIEFDCSAPGIAGGGDDKARREIAKLAELDTVEGHYAEGNCRRQKKNFAEADKEFDEALAGHPKSADLIYDIGDYAMRQNEAQKLKAVVREGESVAPEDPRGGFYEAVALVLTNERPEEAEHLLREYLKKSIVRNNFPHQWLAHEWMGRLCENRNQKAQAIEEYETALRLEPRAKNSREALKRLKKG